MKHTKKEPLSRPYMVDTLKGGRRAREGGGAQGRDGRGNEGGAFLSTIYGRYALGRGNEGGGGERSINHLPNYKKEKEKNQKKNKKLFSSLSPPHYYSILRYTTYTTLVPQTRSS